MCDCHKYIAAYARHGRHASAFAARCLGLLSPTARNNPKSLAGNASGSLKARIATYCAVQSPMPGSSRKRAMNSSVFNPEKEMSPSQTARAKERIVRARALVNPTREKFASTNFSGAGNRCEMPRRDVTCTPNSRTNLPVRVVAPRTVTCCPRMARTANSNPSQLPGTLNPGRAFTRLASTGLPDKCRIISFGSADKSNIRRTRSTIKKSERGCG